MAQGCGTEGSDSDPPRTQRLPTAWIRELEQSLQVTIQRLRRIEEHPSPDDGEARSDPSRLPSRPASSPTRRQAAGATVRNERDEFLLDTLEQASRIADDVQEIVQRGSRGGGGGDEESKE